MANDQQTTPTDAELAARVGIPLADLDADDLAQLRADWQTDQGDEHTDTAAPSGPRLVTEQNSNTQPHAISLLLECCDKFGINPSVDAQPLELLAWRFYGGSDQPGRVTPDAVVIVTAGGMKLRHYDDPDMPMDPDTELQLRRAFNCFGPDPKDPNRVIALSLPDDLRLPTSCVTGEVVSMDHVYKDGYLKSGGPEAAEAKQRRRDERARRLWINGV